MGLFGGCSDAGRIRVALVAGRLLIFGFVWFSVVVVDLLFPACNLALSVHPHVVTATVATTVGD